jgi:hypothetical protein
MAARGPTDNAATLAGHLQQWVSQHFRIGRMANEIVDFYKHIVTMT